jgi:hypothetical protein
MNGCLYKLGPDDVFIMCSLDNEMDVIFDKEHVKLAGGHFHIDTTTRKILRVGLWWPKLHKE